MASWTNFFWLIGAFLLLLVLSRWIERHTQGLGFLLSNNQATALWLYFFLFLPGILVHETSHYVTATLLGVKASNFKLWPTLKKGGQLVLGSVQVRGAGPLRHSLIGAAPLFWGSALVMLIGRFLHFDALGPALTGGNVEQILALTGQSLSTPDFWLWLYLLFAVANSMLPSPADRLYWTPVLLFFGVIAALMVGFDMMPVISDSMQEGVNAFFAFMASSFSIAVGVDLFFVVFIFVLEALIGFVTGRRLQY